MRNLGDDEELSLTVEQARTMPDEQLGELFAEMVVDLWGTFVDDARSETFPRDPYEMTRSDHSDSSHAYWFDPRGGHAAPEKKPDAARPRRT